MRPGRREVVPWCTVEILRKGPALHPLCRVALRFRYEVSVIADLKAFIPSEHRAYDEETQTWYVRLEDLPVAETLARRFPDATRIEGNRMTNLHTGDVTEQLMLLGDECK